MFILPANHIDVRHSSLSKMLTEVHTNLQEINKKVYSIALAAIKYLDNASKNGKKPILNMIKNLSFGALAGGVIGVPLNELTYHAGKSLNFFESLPELSDWLSTLEVFLQVSFNKEKIINAACPLKEFSSQIQASNKGSLLEQLGIKTDSSSDLKKSIFKVAVLQAAVYEELIFRGLIQDILLKRIPQLIIKKLAPGKEKLLDTKTAQAFRITISATAFSAIHLINLLVFPKEYVIPQVVITFVLGIFLGVIKESRLGLAGTIGAHALNNTMAITPILTSC